MANAPLPAPRVKSEDATIATLARQTHTSPDEVEKLLNEELASLSATATVKNFVNVIASRRVKQRLLKRAKTQKH